MLRLTLDRSSSARLQNFAGELGSEASRLVLDSLNAVFPGCRAFEEGTGQPSDGDFKNMVRPRSRFFVGILLRRLADARIRGRSSSASEEDVRPRSDLLDGKTPSAPHTVSRSSTPSPRTKSTLITAPPPPSSSTRLTSSRSCTMEGMKSGWRGLRSARPWSIGRSCAGCYRTMFGLSTDLDTTSSLLLYVRTWTCIEASGRVHTCIQHPAKPCMEDASNSSDFSTLRCVASRSPIDKLWWGAGPLAV